ncbi:MAG: Sir2 family NAD-dependent protein deacetylase [Verrucomicrobia bacterium]|nr:Sir2 family NAD-dependent protein deacetylase [Verrucomicrobiota bacterium]
MPNARLTDYLTTKTRILIFTGAGVSTPSGIPDFRGPGGVWTKRAPIYYADFMSSETARIEHWDYKLEAWPAFRTAKPNGIHQAIVDLEQAGKVVAVVTQNIDGLHALAGTRNLIELHGTNAMVECQSCLLRSDPEPHYEFFRRHRTSPRCSCGGFLKPATISFGQNLDSEVLAQASAAARKADLVIALGSTLSVYPAASFPLMAAERGAPYIVINRGPTDHDGLPVVALRLDGDLIEIFPPAVQQALRGSS